MNSDRADQLTENDLAWFPLVQRTRPPGLPLEIRVRQLRDLVAQAESNDQCSRAAEVCNKAALIASDCGQSELARSLCWRQYDVFNQARPLPTSTTELALQPVLNLPRQLIREGDGDGAYAMLHALYRAARGRTEAMIDGRYVSLRNVTCAADDHRLTCTVIWAALLADGARALARAGRWQEAAQRAAAHRGVGRRPLDGRQVTILALAQNGQPEQAAALVEQSVTLEPWERAVQSLLRVHCLRAAGADASLHISPMLTTVLYVLRQPDPSTAVFRARAGMIALGLAHQHDDPQVQALHEALIDSAFGDTYVARDALAHRILPEKTTAGQARDLADLVRASGLGAGAIPEPMYGDLMDAAASAEDQLRADLDQLNADSRGSTAAS